MSLQVQQPAHAARDRVPAATRRPTGDEAAVQQGTRMPRVCLYQRYLPPDPSGAGKQALTLAHLLRRRGFEVVLLGDLPPGLPAPDRIEDVPVRWIEALPDRGGYRNLLAYWARLWAQLVRLRTRFDVLHVHSAAFQQAAAVPMARLLGKPALVRSSIAGEFGALGSSRSGRLQLRMLGLVSQFVVLSRRIAEEYLQAGLPPERLHLVQNGVDDSRYHPVSPTEKQALRRELGLPAEGHLLIYHGVFIERKSLHWLVDTVGPSLERYGLTLVLVGGPAREEPKTGYAGRLMEQIAQHPCRDRIVVRGFAPDVHRYLQAADLYVLPSTSEGMSNALLEAMAAGLVPIVSRTSGSEDVVQDGVSGFLFEPRDAEALLERLDRCCGPGGATVLADCSAAALQRIRAEFSIQATGRRYGDLYRRMTA
ncbi:MAG TPA: glycosyltransferase family 4 protein [Longimicrobiaceae bacterium]|nr:glycosyltransferase family 4 protein [Longimicrobiaceae bacterium]